MNNKIKYLLLQSLILTFISTTFITAQTISTDLKTLTKNSEVILVGKVQKQKSNWNEEKTQIYTDVTVKVYEYFKGQKYESSIVVKHLGGEVGEVGELYTHIPTFKENETVVLFANRNEIDGKYVVNNGDNGKIQIAVNEDIDENIIMSNPRLLELKKSIKTYTEE